MSSQGRTAWLLRLSGGSLNAEDASEPSPLRDDYGTAPAPPVDLGGLTLSQDKIYLGNKGVKRVVNLIGKGTFSKVYECNMPRHGGRVAVKIIQRPSETDSRHLEFGAQLDHPHLVKLMRVLDTDPLCAVYKLCMGGTLFEALRDRKEMGLLPRATAMHQVFTAVAYLHDCSILHRDIKPENVFLTKPAQGDGGLPPVVLGDLGFARVVPLGDGADLTSCGTVRYMAPEVLEGKCYGKPADIFSCGICLYEAITGDLPDTGRVLRFREVKIGMRTIEGKRPCLDAVVQHGPAGVALAEVLAEAWAQEPVARMNAADLAERVRGCVDHLCEGQGAEAEA